MSEKIQVSPYIVANLKPRQIGYKKGRGTNACTFLLNLLLLFAGRLFLSILLHWAFHWRNGVGGTGRDLN